MKKKRIELLDKIYNELMGINCYVKSITSIADRLSDITKVLESIDSKLNTNADT